MLYTSLLVWIDDIIVFAMKHSSFLLKVKQFLQLTTQHGLKLNVAKTQLLCHEVNWCGKYLGEHGVRHDPARLEALTAL